MACNAVLIFWHNSHIAPPLKCCGVSLTSDHISVSLEFHVANAPSRFSTIQLSSKLSPPEKDSRLFHWKQAAESRLCSLLQNQIQNFLCKRDDQTAEKGQEAGAALRWVMGLQAQANLHHAPAKQDHADGFDCGKDEGRQVVDGSQRIVTGGESGRTDGAGENTGQHSGEVTALCLARPFVRVQNGFLLHFEFPPVFQDF